MDRISDVTAHYLILFLINDCLKKEHKQRTSAEASQLNVM